MEKKVFVNCILFVIVVVGLICFFLIFHNTSRKNLELEYKTNGGVPFKWEFEIEDPDIIEFSDKKEEENNNKDGMVGAKIVTKYIFKGLKEGKTSIIFRYVDVRDGTISEEVINKVSVDKNKNARLIKD